MSAARNTMAAVLAAILITLSGSAVAEEARTVVIEIKSFKFVPDRPQIRSGDTVVWRNLDIVPHTATAMDSSWDSASIEANGGEWRLVVNERTTLDYYCRFHPSMLGAMTRR